MSSIVGEVAVRVRGDTTTFKRDVQKGASSPAIATAGAKAGKKAGGGFSKAFGAAGLAIGPAGITAAVGVIGVAVGRELVGAAQEAERQMVAVNASLNASGVPAGKAAAAISKVSAAAIKLGFDDEDAAASLATLTRASGSVGRAQTLTAAAFDVARAKNIDLAAATKVVTLAQLGNVRGLKQLGITVAPVTTAQDKLKESIAKLRAESKGADDVTKARIATDIEALKATAAAAKADDVRATSTKAIATIQKQLGTQAEEFATTTAGAQARAGVAFANLKESAGAALLPLVTLLANALVPAFEGLAIAIEQTTAFITRVWDQWGDQITSVAQTVARLVVAYVRPAFELVKGIIQTVTALLRGDWSAAWNEAKATVSNVVSAVVALVRATLGKLPGIALAAAAATVSALRSGLAAMPGVALSIATRAGTAIANGIKTAASKLAGLAGDLLAKISAAISQVASQVAAKAFSIGANLITGIISGITSKLGDLRDKAGEVAGLITDHFPNSPQAKIGPLRNLLAQGAAIVTSIAEGITKAKGRLGPALTATIREGLKEQSRAAASALQSSVGAIAGSIGKVLDAQLARALGGLELTSAFASRVAEIAATGASIAAAEANAQAAEVDARVAEAGREVQRLRSQALTIDKGLTDALDAARSAGTSTVGFAARRAADAAFLAAQGAVNDALVVAAQERNAAILVAEQALVTARTESDKFYFERRKAALDADLAAERTRLTDASTAAKEAAEQQLSALALNLSQKRITIAEFDAGVKQLLSDSVGDYASIGSDIGLGLGQAFGAQFVAQVQAAAAQAAQVLRAAAATGFESDPTTVSISGNIGDAKQRLKDLTSKRATEAGQVAAAEKAVKAAQAQVAAAAKTKDTADDKKAAAALATAKKALDTQENQLAAAQNAVKAQVKIIEVLERIEKNAGGTSTLAGGAAR